MAIGTHIAFVRFVSVDAVGNVINERTSQLNARLTGSSEHRVIPDAAIPNTSSNPTIKEYLEAEAADDYVIGHISQNMIVTYSASDLNGV